MRRIALALSVAIVSVSAFSSGSNASGLKIVHAFGGTDGAQPNGSLVSDSAGNLYGTTEFGGANNAGTIFRLAPDGTETVLFSFTGKSEEGGYPREGLLRTPDGILYGATPGGGVDYGVVYRLSSQDDYSVVHAFAGDPADGARPRGPLAMDASGNLYGVTEAGGGCGDFGCGMIFKISSDGAEELVYDFTFQRDGASPEGGLVADAKGNLFGTTAEGGAHGNGTVFEFTANGNLKTLYAFRNKSDGAVPLTGVSLDSDGNIYGTNNGTFGPGYGLVYRIAPDGTFQTLYTFTGNADGENPNLVIPDGAGNLYGTTLRGGTRGCGTGHCGTIFKIGADGSKTTLYSFAPQRGAAPVGTLLLLKGKLFGAASERGPNGEGSIFSLKK